MRYALISLLVLAACSSPTEPEPQPVDRCQVDAYGRNICDSAWREARTVPLLDSMTNPNAKPLQPIPTPPEGCKFVAPLTVQFRIWCAPTE